MARISQLTDSAHGLRKIITSPELEFGSNKHKEEAIQVFNDVNNHLYALQLFDENFTQFKIEKDKVITWICETESQMNDLESEFDLKKLWVNISDVPLNLCAYSILFQLHDILH